MSLKLQWGIIGTGRIAGTFASGLAESSTGELLGVGSRTRESAEAFGEEHGASRRYDSYEGLLADPDVEAVYVSTPHPWHAEWAIKVAEAGKHVLCEKPLGVNHAEAMAIVQAARENDVFLMEAFMYRCHPQTAKLVELVRSGAIGEVRVIEAAFSFNAGFSPESRLFAQALAGGGILDVGCYAASMARLIAGAAIGKDFDDPVEVKGTGHLGETGVDEWTVASLKFASEVVAEVATGVRVQQENTVRIYGSEGRIIVPAPWQPGYRGLPSKILVFRKGAQDPEEIDVSAPVGIYTLEADTVAAHVRERQAPSPAMSWDDSLGNMKTLDAWRSSIGLVYDLEKPEAQVLPVHRRPLAVRADSRMTYGEIAGIDRKISRLVMGCDNQLTMPHAAVMFDSYFERGGNCFDTAYVYGGGLQEKLLGQWVANRGVRDQIVVIGKGVHTPFNRPEHLRPQLEQTLERLQMDHVDLYIAHRDNEEVPVGEWAGAFNEALSAGLARAYGGSNWALARVEALNQQARSKGLVEMAVVSNNFSLARMVEPVWRGCVSASDPESRAWLERTQMPLFAWSSQARGFFTDRAAPDKRSDESLVRCWYSEDNFRRKERADELARKKGVLPINIALAYVLAQPFPTFALIGPRDLNELAGSLEALKVHLTPEEVRWLNLEA